MTNKRKAAGKKRPPQKVFKAQFSLAEALSSYGPLHKPGAASKPVKIAADFDTALAALAAVPPPKKRRKPGRS